MNREHPSVRVLAIALQSFRASHHHYRYTPGDDLRDPRCAELVEAGRRLADAAEKLVADVAETRGPYTRHEVQDRILSAMVESSDPTGGATDHVMHMLFLERQRAIGECVAAVEAYHDEESNIDWDDDTGRATESSREAKAAHDLAIRLKRLGAGTAHHRSGPQ